MTTSQKQASPFAIWCFGLGLILLWLAFSGMVDSQLAEESLMPFVLLLVGICSVTVSAEQQWFSRHSEGWFWYEQIAEPETDENEANDPNERHQPLTTAWIRNNIGLYLDKAIDLPSKENVSNYLYLDRLIKEKAERFAYVGKQIIESDPMLDENVPSTNLSGSGKNQR